MKHDSEAIKRRYSHRYTEEHRFGKMKYL